MKDKKYYIGQILERCNRNLVQMAYWASRGKLLIVQDLESKTQALLEILENVFNYTDTQKIKDNMFDYICIAEEHDYFSNFEFL